MPYWTGAGDWLVLSSVYEGWATVYFEALARGRPVITSDVSAAKDAVCDRAYGLVVEPNTANAWAQALACAADARFDPSVIRAYAERHSWDNWAQSCLNIIVEVCRDRLM